MENLEKLAELAKDLPAKLKDNASSLVERMGEVIEGIGDRPVVWRPETLKLVQGTSDRSKLPKGANIGSIVVGETILEQPTKVIPLRSWTSRQFWDPNPDNARMLCNSPDGNTGFAYGDCRQCQYSKFDVENNRGQCNKTITIMFITEDLNHIVLANFAKTNYANGNDWLSLMKKASVAPYKRVYELNSETSKKAKNVEVLVAASAGAVDVKLIPFLEELATRVGEDRKVSLEKFYEYIKNRKEQGATAALEAPADTVLLAAESEAGPGSDSTTTVVDAEIAEEGGGYKNYSL